MTTMDATSPDFTEWLTRNPQPALHDLVQRYGRLSPRTGGRLDTVRSRQRRLAGAAHPSSEMGVRPTAPSRRTAAPKTLCPGAEPC
jgi:hypothetical protein